MRREAFIVTFAQGDFVHHLFDNWTDAAKNIVENGHGQWFGNELFFDSFYDVERVTVH